MANEEALRSQAIAMHSQGKSVATIARDLANGYTNGLIDI